ncbi:MAG TPA: DUF4386 domain-containing protein [Candidatus Dormibacteraeota bacterium]|jgi:hypothetical protein|nr:DUF4386 domain-containing protein [Candidatus Dormibacteraeota bacterium]
MSSLSRDARVAGILYIASSVPGFFRLIYIPSALFVAGNAAATAGNIAAHESLFRIGIVAYLVCNALWIFVVLDLYRLLKRVDRTLAWLLVILGLVVVPIAFVNSANDVAALLFIRGGDVLAVFDQSQRDGIAVLFLNLHHQVDLAFDLLGGLWFIPLGLLVYRSRFLPRLLGVWLLLACIGYESISFSGFLFPAYADTVSRLAGPALTAEVATMLWLTIRGVNEKTAAPQPQSAAQSA